MARAAGVSVGTASKALNDKTGLRPETVARVRQAAELLGYHPNDLFQSLVRKRSFTVGLISTYGRFSLPILEGVEDTLGAAEISVFLCYAPNDPEKEARHIRSLLAKRVDGIIVSNNIRDGQSGVRPPLDLGNTRVPVVYAYTRVASPDAVCLLPDNEQGGHLAVSHLIKSGRRRFAYITGPRSSEAGRLRKLGAEQALAASGLTLSRSRIRYGEWSEASGYQAVQDLLDRGASFDALFCGNDQLARGAEDALRERGIRVPDDVAVVGFDNWTEIAEAARPPLTTIDMNLHELGRRAGLKLLDLFDGRKEAGLQLLPCQLVVRRSCGTTSPLATERKDGDPPQS